MKQKKLFSLLAFISLLPILSITASANSSWVWLTRDPRPMLPWAIAGTLIIEMLIVYYFNKIRIRKTIKPAISVIISNLISFLAPYVFVGVTPNAMSDAENFFARIDFMAERLPFYIVRIAFLGLTLVIEVPIVYFGTRKMVQNKKRLLFTIIAANVITTIAITIIERTFYKGYW